MERQAPAEGTGEASAGQPKEHEMRLNTKPKIDYEHFAATLGEALLGDAVDVLRSTELWTMVLAGGVPVTDQGGM